MGFDITYHPISEHEIQEWYFDAMNDLSLIEKLAIRNKMDEFHKEKYEDIILLAKETQPADIFDMTHGRYISVIQGFFRTYFYTRNSAFSFLIDQYPFFKKYTKGWAEIIHGPISNPINDRITENYSSGIFIPEDQVSILLSDYRSNQSLRDVLDSFYSHERITVFIKALEFSKQNRMGILEAADVIEPNVRELNNTLYYSNACNCDQEGILLYVEEAMKKMNEAEKFKGSGQQNRKIPNNQISDLDSDQLKNKKGFWRKLLGI
ncbi:hypothetical protein [Chryseobacterium vrystaatense]|uniref:Uncharacterized protein n=1 Tax=Chryseobacterium vrystaatense TaxID=307480 RepID=A0A1M5DNG1_9FLAO|nr:hypothetical protein [Chryseobacterium vrystaatense]SHF68435.1 hypothetical protein SAMN02787073_2661 [Chryseobacterium vrystaatense]